MATSGESGPDAASLSPVLVHETQNLAAGIRGLTLTAPDGGDLPSWRPGAHIDLVLPSGTVRTYSLCGDPATLSTYEIAVLRDPASRGGSIEVHDNVRAGDRLMMRGPRNHFPLEPASCYLFVAGGIGITPLLSMLAEADRQKTPWRLVYGGRSRSSMAFLDLLSRWPDQVDVLPHEEVGLLDIPRLVQPGTGEHVYCCGPSPLLDAVREHCTETDTADQLHYERFTAQAAAPATEDLPFTVQVGDNGPQLDIPADCSILSVLLDAGVPVAFSCEEGTCGSCETKVLAGEPDHRDELLTPQERAAGSMLICISRSRCPRLVLDLDAG